MTTSHTDRDAFLYATVAQLADRIRVVEERLAGHDKTERDHVLGYLRETLLLNCARVDRRLLLQDIIDAIEEGRHRR